MACTFSSTTAKTGFSPTTGVDLLNEIESEYRANLDFIRFIDEIEGEALLEAETWEQLAVIEAMMLNDSNLEPYHYPLFGTQANNGPGSSHAVDGPSGRKYRYELACWLANGGG